MISRIEFKTTDGLYRLEALLPGAIRVVHTKADAIAPPVLLQDPDLPEDVGDFADGGQDERCVWLRSGKLLGAYDRASGRLTWRRADTGELLLREAGHVLSAQDVIRYTTGGEAPQIERVKTVDGERNFIKNLKPVVDRRAWRARLCFDFDPDEGIYGLGQGEDGVWNNRHQNRYLYQHNMRIPMPFFLSDRGYGLLVDCGSLMTFQDDAEGSYLFLDTVSQLDYCVIIGDERIPNPFDAVIDGLRRLTDAILKVCGGRAAVFRRTADGYQYAIGQENGDLRAFTKELNAKLSGRGGGKPGFVQGSVKAELEEIRDFFQNE